MFAACGEPSVFALMKSYLDCRLWQWHMYLLESVIIYRGKILWSSTTFGLRGHPSLFMSLSSPVHSFFSEYTKLLIWPLLMFLLYICWIFFCFLTLTIVCFTCMESSFDHMMWVQSNSFQMQMAHLINTESQNKLQNLNLLNWCRNKEGIAHACPWNSFWVNCPITYVSFKRGEVHIKEL